MTRPAHIDVAALDALLAPYDRSDAPGFAVGVALPGFSPYRRGVGMASVELPVVLSPSIRMRIGSTSKHFTCLAILLLAEEGRLSPDDPVRLHIPELPAWADGITLRHMMAHRSGMRDSLDIALHTAGPGVGSASDFHLETLASIDSVNFRPDEDWNYNNGAYVLLGEVIQRASGQAFADFLRDHIFRPVGMRATQVRPLDTELLPNSATLHVPVSGGGYARGVFGLPIGAEGGIVSTVDDMLLWLHHMSHPIVGSRATWDAMRTPLTSHGYGLGLIASDHRGLPTVHHGGAVVGGNCQMLKVVGPDLDIIVMSNGLGGLDLHRLVDAIIDCCIPDLPAIAHTATMPSVTGIFHSPEKGDCIAFEERGGELHIRLGAAVLPAQQYPDGSLGVPMITSDLRIWSQGDGSELLVKEFGKERFYTRAMVPDAETLPTLSGWYLDSSACVAALIEQLDGEHYLHLMGRLGSTRYRLKPVGSGLWEGECNAALPRVIWVDAQDNDIWIVTGRTKRLKLEKDEFLVTSDRMKGDMHDVLGPASTWRSA